MFGARATAIAVAVAITTAACGSGSGEDDGAGSGPIKLGAPIDISGGLAATGKDVLAGAELAVEQLNEDGGVLGRQVELIVRDNQSKPEVAVEEARKLVEDEGVVALLGPASSAAALAVSTSVSGPMKTLMFTNSANSSALTVDSFQPYLFALGPNSLMESKGQAKVLAEGPARKYGLLAADYEGGHANVDAFKEFMKGYLPDVEFVKELYPPLGSKDYTPYINQLLSAKPDYVFSVLFGGDLIAFTKQAQAVGFFDKIKFTALYDTTTLAALADDAPVGVRGYGRAPFFAVDTPQAKEFTEAFKAKNDKYPADWSFLGYDAIMLWAQAVEEGETLDSDELLPVLEDGEWESLRGPIKVREVDHQANAPEYYYDITAVDPEFGVPIGENAVEIPGDEIMLSEQEVLERRK